MYRQFYGMGKREVSEVLRRHGITPTVQRVEIAHLVLEKAQHISAEEIVSRLNSDCSRASQATVYNTMRLLVEKGIIRELIFSSNRVYYDSNIAPHHHFIDSETGRIFDLPSDLLDRSALRLAGLEADVEEISLLVRGRLRDEAMLPEMPPVSHTRH